MGLSCSIMELNKNNVLKGYWSILHLPVNFCEFAHLHGWGAYLYRHLPVAKGDPKLFLRILRSPSVRLYLFKYFTDSIPSLEQKHSAFIAQDMGQLHTVHTLGLQGSDILKNSIFFNPILDHPHKYIPWLKDPGHNCRQTEVMSCSCMHFIPIFTLLD